MDKRLACGVRRQTVDGGEVHDVLSVGTEERDRVQFLLQLCQAQPRLIVRLLTRIHPDAFCLHADVADVVGADHHLTVLVRTDDTVAVRPVAQV